MYSFTVLCVLQAALFTPSNSPCVCVCVCQVLHLCFKMYTSRDLNIHNTAGVVIRQIVSAMFERLNSFIGSSGSFDWGGGQDSAHTQLPVQASDAYLLFQVSTYYIWTGVFRVYTLPHLTKVYLPKLYYDFHKDQYPQISCTVIVGAPCMLLAQAWLD